MYSQFFQDDLLRSWNANSQANTEKGDVLSVGVGVKLQYLNIQVNPIYLPTIAPG
jgi:hypothetical protein